VVLLLVLPRKTAVLLHLYVLWLPFLSIVLIVLFFTTGPRSTGLPRSTSSTSSPQSRDTINFEVLGIDYWDEVFCGIDHQADLL
jgi:hypothetical protein